MEQHIYMFGQSQTGGQPSTDTPPKEVSILSLNKLIIYKKTFFWNSSILQFYFFRFSIFSQVLKKIKREADIHTRVRERVVFERREKSFWQQKSVSRDGAGGDCFEGEASQRTS